MPRHSGCSIDHCCDGEGEVRGAGGAGRGQSKVFEERGIQVGRVFGWSPGMKACLVAIVYPFGLIELGHVGDGFWQFAGVGDEEQLDAFYDRVR